MKALILAAGFGTRLLPHTSVCPKPLFTLDGVPILQRCIEQLIEAGCTEIIINTHHLHHKIEQFIENYKANRVKANRVKANRVKANRVKANRVESNGVESNRVKSENSLTVTITTIYEPEILDTGGAIRNVHGFMNNEPFMVINSDIISDIDLRMVWNFHLSGNWCATLVLHDYPLYNKVVVNNNLFIKDFSGNTTSVLCDHVLEFAGTQELEFAGTQVLAFTGIQVLSSEIFDYIYSSKKKYNTSELFALGPFSSIDLYSHLANKGNLVKAFICKDIFWQDIGTFDTYRDAAIRFTIANQLKTDNLFLSSPVKNISLSPVKNISLSPIKKIAIEKLAGDGSDRKWFRCRLSDNLNHSLIVADHGISSEEIHGVTSKSRHHKNQEISSYKNQEIDSFIRIGNHLFEKGVPVPKIKEYDRFAGIVVLEDLGDTHLQDLIKRIEKETIENNKLENNKLENNKLENNKLENYRLENNKLENNTMHQHFILECYRKICRLAISFSMQGIKGFDDSWTFQTPSYSKEMILEKECRYFVEAFLQGYLKQDVRFDDFIDEFEFIAENALDGAFEGLMHRDMQSRNIMVKGVKTLSTNLLADEQYLNDANFFFIDFQSARRGPFQYDLASLLIDPYVNLSDEIKETLLYECSHQIEMIIRCNPDNLDQAMSNQAEFNQDKFIKSYRYCSITRNMQMLGAFSHLSMNRGKTSFQQYIPMAVNNLKKSLTFLDIDKIKHLYDHINICITTI